MSVCEECGKRCDEGVDFTHFVEGVKRVHEFCCSDCLRFWLRRHEQMPKPGLRIPKRERGV